MPHRHCLLASVAVFTALLILPTRSASAADLERGRGLYESSCGNCQGATYPVASPDR